MPDKPQTTCSCTHDCVHQQSEPAWDQDAIDNEMFRDEEECDHLEAELDILTGRESCHCGYTRWLTTEEFQHRLKIETEAYEAYHKEMEEAVKQEMEKDMPEITPVRINDDELSF